MTREPQAALRAKRTDYCKSQWNPLRPLHGQYGRRRLSFAIPKGGTMNRLSFSRLAMMLALAAAPLAAVAQTVPVVGLVELSGGGATVGTNFDNAVKLAVKEINAAGGLAGKKIEYTSYDTQTNASVAKALTQKAIDQNAYVVMGPVFSGSIVVSMQETGRAEVTNFVGGEAASITQQGNPYVFRTSFTQAAAMPKVAKYMKDTVKAKKVAVIYANTDFGKGGRDVILPVLKANQSNADALFVYCHEEESARLLRELRKQAYDKPIIGETTIANEKVIELAGDAANGVVAHVGLTADAQDPNVQAFVQKFMAEYKYKPDHNAMKGYTGMWAVKAMTDKIGKLVTKALAKAFHGATISAKQYPGVLFDTKYDDKGDLDRESFFVKIEKGKSNVIYTFKPGGSA